MYVFQWSLCKWTVTETRIAQLQHKMFGHTVTFSTTLCHPTPSDSQHPPWHKPFSCTVISPVTPEPLKRVTSERYEHSEFLETEHRLRLQIGSGHVVTIVQLTHQRKSLKIFVGTQISSAGRDSAFGLHVWALWCTCDRGNHTLLTEAFIGVFCFFALSICCHEGDLLLI